MFTIHHKDGWGNVLLAGRDMLPGVEIFRDRGLLELRRQDDNTEMRGLEDCLIKAYYDFRSELSEEEQDKILALPVNTNCPFARVHRQLFQDWTPANYLVAKLGIAAFEIDKLIHVLCVMRQRILEDITASTCYAYGTASLLYPSCTSNCYLDMQVDRCVCRALVPIKGGDLLTVSVKEEWSPLSVAARRHHLLDEMDFTCHCARCDALGDDARRFPCFNKRCTGYHWVCQPRELKDPEGQHYDGVEYVEPHLLPCTVCQHSPPLEYQARVLQEEQLTGKFSKELEQGRNGPPHQILMHLARCAVRPVTQLHTVEGLYQTQVELVMRNCMQLSDPRALMLAASLEASYDLLLRIPMAAKYQVVGHAVTAFLLGGRPQRALVLARRLLRAHRIREGRVAPAPLVEPLLDCALAVCGGANTAPVGCCVYCEEFPERAAMKRSRCGACMKVVYCGAACQKAHWKVHRRQCKRD
jgi:hypothetical protein